MNTKPLFVSYAQNAEDIALNRVFRDQPEGFYIDVGAHDPVEFSVTKFFYDRGWHGVNIEPVSTSIKSLQSHRPRDLNLNVAVGDRTGSRTLYEIVGRPECATLDREVASNTQRILGAEAVEYQVPVHTLAEICERHAASRIDFVKIDVEGPEKEVIAGADFRRFRPVMLVIEATIPCSGTVKNWLKDRIYDWEKFGNWAEWEPALLDSGYLLAYFDGLNRYYLREEDAALKERFSVPVSQMQDGFEPYATVLEREHLASGAQKLQSRIDALEQEIERLKRDASSRE